jgi:hypothetical protein
MLAVALTASSFSEVIAQPGQLAESLERNLMLRFYFHYRDG